MIPALTMVAEWRYAETGVGAAIAPGSQEWKGAWALFVRMAGSSSASAIVFVAGASSRSSSAERLAVPATDPR